MLKLVYGDAVVTMKTVYKCFERFRNGCELAEDEERSLLPSTAKTQKNVESLSGMIRLNRRLTITEISEDLNISYGSVQKHLNYRFEHEASEFSVMTTVRVTDRFWYSSVET